MSEPLRPETVAEILRLYRLGWLCNDVAVRTDVSKRSVKRYVLRFIFDVRPDFEFKSHKAYNPLYDPLRDGSQELSNTAQICGDPQPGRRELVAKSVVKSYDLAAHRD